MPENKIKVNAFLSIEKMSSAFPRNKETIAKKANIIKALTVVARVESIF